MLLKIPFPQKPSRLKFPTSRAGANGDWLDDPAALSPNPKTLYQNSGRLYFLVRPTTTLKQAPKYRPPPMWGPRCGRRERLPCLPTDQLLCRPVQGSWLSRQRQLVGAPTSRVVDSKPTRCQHASTSPPTLPAARAQSAGIARSILSQTLDGQWVPGSRRWRVVRPRGFRESLCFPRVQLAFGAASQQARRVKDRGSRSFIKVVEFSPPP